MTRFRVTIIGGGLAGMAAAETLSRIHPEVHVSLLESKRTLGGRAGSYLDPTSDQEIDYCQHAAMGCCTNLIDLLERCGLLCHFRRSSSLTFLHPEHPPSRFAPTRLLPPPLHLLGSIAALQYLTAKQKREIKRGLWKLMRTPAQSLGQTRARDWLDAAGQSEGTRRDFWDVILVSALGEQTDRVSMAAARKVLIDGFAAARGASDVLIPTLPLADLFGRRLAAVIADRGVEIRTRCPVQHITPSGDVITAADRLKSDAVICAVPWHQIAKLFDQWPHSERSQLPNLSEWTRIPASPISGLHLWFDRPITDLDHAVMVGTLSQWLFRDPCQKPERCPKPERTDENPIAANETSAPPVNDRPLAARQHYYQVVISASADLVSTARQKLVATVLTELRHAFPDAQKANLVRHRLVTDPKSVFSLRPEIDAIRPESATGIPWLCLAGDWTQTQWPATMEGAVISGRQAVQAAENHLRNIGFAALSPSATYPCPGLPPGRLARWLIRHD